MGLTYEIWLTRMETVEILKGVASGLVYMHDSPIMVKPDNVVLTAVSEELNLRNAISEVNQ